MFMNVGCLIGQIAKNIKPGKLIKLKKKLIQNFILDETGIPQLYLSFSLQSAYHGENLRIFE